jgi:hypothetical protein
MFGRRLQARILVEASTESEWVARCLEDLGHEVIVADPNHAARYARRTRRVKTDRRQPLERQPVSYVKLKVVLSIAAGYLALVGLGMMFVPHYFGVGAVPADASPALIAFLRIFGGPCLGIAALNWSARNAEPSRTLRAVVLGNLVGFACVAASDVLSVFTGSARPIAKLFLVVHLSMTVAFFLQWRAIGRAVIKGD